MTEEMQKQTIDFILEYQRRTGVSPTIRDIQAGIGAASTSTVKRRLVELRDAGRVTWQPGKARTLRVLPPQQEEMPF